MEMGQHIYTTYLEIFNAGLVQVDPRSRGVFRGIDSVLALFNQAQGQVGLVGKDSTTEGRDKDLMSR